jgi:hypothetical protein
MISGKIKLFNYSFSTKCGDELKCDKKNSFQ